MSGFVINGKGPPIDAVDQREPSPQNTAKNSESGSDSLRKKMNGSNDSKTLGYDLNETPKSSFAEGSGSDQTAGSPNQGGIITDVLLHSHYAQILMGTAVVQPELYNDLDGMPRIHFIFADLAIRSSGKYRLRFQLFFLPSEEQPLLSSPLQVVSNIFTVFSPKTFPGMSPSTNLSNCLAIQGAKINTRKTLDQTGARF
jgi:hypothetical protein